MIVSGFYFVVRVEIDYPLLLMGFAVPIPDNDASAPEASDALESTADYKQEKEEVPEKEAVEAASDDSNKLSGDIGGDNAAKAAVAPESAVAEPADEETSSQEAPSRASTSEAAAGERDVRASSIARCSSVLPRFARRCNLREARDPIW